MDDRLSPRDATLTLNGLRFHYRDWGDPQAPPLLLLHGYTSHGRSWDTIARALAGRFRVLVLDQRGHGESDHASDYDEQRLIEDLAAFVDALDIGRFAAAGFSIGGFAAASHAVLHPERVTRCSLQEGRGLSTNCGARWRSLLSIYSAWLPSFSFRKTAIVSSARSAASSVPTLAGKTCGIPSQTCTVASTPTRRARAA
jgi:pimeloyl-ACP methyl ester carboxylesterase